MASGKEKVRPIGLVAATFTPFKEDGSINLEIIPQYVDYLLTQDVKSVWVNGTTGEAMSLTVEERKQLAQTWVTAAKEKLQCVTVHVGGSNVHESIEMAVHAQSIGADAISAICSTYFKPKTIDALVTYCSKIAEAAPDLPFYYYHIPQMTGVDFSMEEFLLAAKDCIPTLVGVKYSGRDIYDATQCVLAEGGRFHVLYGSDEISLATLVLGITDYVGSTYNFMGHAYHRMRAAVKEGRLKDAQCEIYRSQSTVKIMFKYGALVYNNIGALKPIMELKSGLNLGAPRLPTKAISSEERQQLKQELQGIGFFEWSKSG